MHWYIHENIANEQGHDDLINALERREIPFSIHKTVPFEGTLIPEPDTDTPNAICMGTYSMIKTARKYGWYPGVFDIKSVHFLNQLDHWGSLMLNHDAQVCRFSEIPVDKLPRFIRPIEDSKIFNGQIIDVDNYLPWRDSILRHVRTSNGDPLDQLGETFVQVCEPRQIDVEYRFWIVDYGIATASSYRRNGRAWFSADIDSEAYNFVDHILNRWVPHETFVLDVGRRGDDWFIIEPNTLNCCGFYKADLGKLVDALETSYSDS